MIVALGQHDLPSLVALSLGTDRGRWWADPQMGSDLHRYFRGGKLSTGTAQDWRQSCQQALQWMVDDGLVREVNVHVEVQDKTRLNYHISLTTASGERMRYAF